MSFTEIYYFILLIILCFFCLFCCCENNLEKYCYKNVNNPKKVIPYNIT